jgi:hypothetical protein
MSKAVQYLLLLLQLQKYFKNREKYKYRLSDNIHSNYICMKCSRKLSEIQQEEKLSSISKDLV